MKNNWKMVEMHKILHKNILRTTKVTTNEKKKKKKKRKNIKKNIILVYKQGNKSKGGD